MGFWKIVSQFIVIPNWRLIEYFVYHAPYLILILTSSLTFLVIREIIEKKEKDKLQERLGEVVTIVICLTVPALLLPLFIFALFCGYIYELILPPKDSRIRWLNHLAALSCLVIYLLFHFNIIFKRPDYHFRIGADRFLNRDYQPTPRLLKGLLESDSDAVVANTLRFVFEENRAWDDKTLQLLIDFHRESEDRYQRLRIHAGFVREFRAKSFNHRQIEMVKEYFGGGLLMGHSWRKEDLDEICAKVHDWGLSEPILNDLIATPSDEDFFFDNLVSYLRRYPRKLSEEQISLVDLDIDARADDRLRATQEGLKPSPSPPAP